MIKIRYVTIIHTLYKQVCCSAINALEITDHLSLVEPLCSVQDEHPTVSLWVRLFNGRHILVDRAHDTSILGDSEDWSTVHQPRHDTPRLAGGAAGESGLFSSYDNQVHGRQRHLSSSSWENKNGGRQGPLTSTLFVQLSEVVFETGSNDGKFWSFRK